VTLLRSTAPIDTIPFVRNPIRVEKPRVLVMVPTRNTSRTLEETVRGIPPGVADDVLVVDNGSTDMSVQIAEGLGLKVVRHYFDRGYGASQKTAFSYATAIGAEVIAILHSDLQYPPALLPDVVKPILDGEADLVLGSRVTDRKKALEGGMPKYKFLGNRILTAIENRALGSNLSEFHTGCRAYRVKMLERIPYFFNSDSWLFDSQIIFQIINLRFRVKELPIPCIYDGNSSSVPFWDGMVYGAGVTALSARYYLHRIGLWPDGKYR
jgi:glycosyltransferase involved in cell wall biosynthesis